MSKGISGEWVMSADEGWWMLFEQGKEKVDTAKSRSVVVARGKFGITLRLLPISYFRSLPPPKELFRNASQLL